MNKKRFLVVLTLCIFALTLILTACNIKPDDELDPVDTSAMDSVIKDIKSKSNLDQLSSKTSGNNVTEVTPTSDVVKITKSGTYLFSGEYGGISVKKELGDVHLIFNGVTITTHGDVAISSAKETQLTITLQQGTVNTVVNDGVDSDGGTVNAIHVKDCLAINGKGTLNVTSESKSALKASKEIQIVDAKLNLNAVNHAITGASVIASKCTISVGGAGKDGINVECDGATSFTTDDGFVALTNVTYTCDVEGDGIQASTVVYIDGGSYDIKTTGTFVIKNSANMELYGMTADDFKYTYSNGSYKRVASDEARGTLFGLTQGCKGIKVGLIEYEDDNGNNVEVTQGDYLIAIFNGTFNIDSTDDAIHANGGNVLINGGTFELSTLDDAITSDLLTKITGGKITITSSYEGIEGAYVEISGGTINLKASDDGINAATSDKSITPHIIISGGNITVDASGDGIDSNGSILISGGTVTVFGPTSNGDTGLDADGDIIINGGTLFVTTSSGMVETPSSSSNQYVVVYGQQASIPAGTVVTLRDSSGNKLMEVTTIKSCQALILSCAKLKKNSKYYIYSGDTQLTSFTVSSAVTTIGTISSRPGGGGPTNPGGGGPGGPGGR